MESLRAAVGRVSVPLYLKNEHDDRDSSDSPSRLRTHLLLMSARLVGGLGDAHVANTLGTSAPVRAVLSRPSAHADARVLDLRRLTPAWIRKISVAWTFDDHFLKTQVRAPHLSGARVASSDWHILAATIGEG